MSRIPRGFRWVPGFSAIVAMGAVLVAASGMALPSGVVHADTLGPNLGTVSGPTGDLFSNSGGGGCGGNGTNVNTTTFDTSATDPGFAVSRSVPCNITLVGTDSVGETGVIEGLNGYQIEDISASITCGVTGGDSFTISFNSLVLTCPTETTLGATGTVTGEVTFAPVSGPFTYTITFSGTGVSGGSASWSALSENVSLLAPSTGVPEPGSLSMLLAGLAGLPFLRRRFAR